MMQKILRRAVAAFLAACMMMNIAVPAYAASSTESASSQAVSQETADLLLEQAAAQAEPTEAPAEDATGASQAEPTEAPEAEATEAPQAEATEVPQAEATEAPQVESTETPAAPETAVQQEPVVEEKLVASYDMTTNGTALVDVSGNGNDATLSGTTDASFAGGNWHMNKDSFATLPAGLITGEEFTVQFTATTTAKAAHWMFALGDGFGNWNDKNVGNYIFVNPAPTERNGNILSAIKVGTGSDWKEVRVPDSASAIGLANQQGYATITMVGEGNELRLYLNGQQVSSVTHEFKIQDVIPEDKTGYIGKSLYTSDPLMTANLADFKIWNYALSTEELAAEQPSAEVLAEYFARDIKAAMLGGNSGLEAVTENLSLPSTVNGVAVAWTSDNTDVLANDGTIHPVVGKDTTVKLTASYSLNGEAKTQEFTVVVKGLDVGKTLQEAADSLTIPNADDVRGNFTLPESVGEVSVKWATDHEEIVTVESQKASVDGYDEIPAGVVTRPAEDTKVTMTATLSLADQQTTKQIELTVKAAPEELTDADFTDYFFAYFAGEGYSDGEQIYFASSQDGLNWEDLNDNEPVLYSTLGEQGVRDPFIIRSAEGDRFYLIATDLKINGNNDWSGAQSNGSQSLMIWESNDLVNWSEQRMVDVSSEYDAGCTWAPEATYDPITGEYLVYWASRAERTTGDKIHRIYVVKTRDFYTFTEPEVWIEYDQSSIDTTVIQGEDGKYYRFTKNEGTSTNELGALTKTVFLETADTLLGEWTQIKSDSLNGEQWVEGPTIFRLNADDRENGQYCLLLDDFGGIGYYPVVTDDLASGVFTAPDTEFKMPSRARHGTPLRITAEEYETIQAKWGDAVMPDPGVDPDPELAKLALEETGGLTYANGAITYLRSGCDTLFQINVDWNNTNSYHATINDAQAKFGTTAFTVLMDVKTEDSASGDLLARGAALNIGNDKYALRIGTYENGNLRFGSYSGGVSTSSAELNGFEKGEWNAIALTYEEKAGGNGSVVVYVNGVKAAEVADIGFKLSTMTDIQAMLGRMVGTSYLQKGLYDSIVVVDEVLDAEKLQTETLARKYAKETLPMINTANLEANLEKAEALVEAGLTSDRLEAAMTAAKDVLANENKTQTMVDEADSELIAAIGEVQPTEILLDGADVDAAAENVNGLTWKGWGMLNGNSTSNLLLDYKAEHPDKYWEMMEYLFGGEHPLFTHIKMEMGNDGNNSTGAEACTMRWANDKADASRSPGFVMAADAKAVNPDVKISVLRWMYPD
ncbi:immunoglobulin-like domain-containing protein, partial [Gemmiger sp. An194]|uniref:immunoglobulin-like domain-containing protein n=1 Tax=Gemmiger sp. An194 TaxID=1965582 RepID=UPI0013024F34